MSCSVSDVAEARLQTIHLKILYELYLGMKCCMDIQMLTDKYWLMLSRLIISLLTVGKFVLKSIAMYLHAPYYFLIQYVNLAETLNVNLQKYWIIPLSSSMKPWSQKWHFLKKQRNICIIWKNLISFVFMRVLLVSTVEPIFQVLIFYYLWS